MINDAYVWISTHLLFEDFSRLNSMKSICIYFILYWAKQISRYIIYGNKISIFQNYQIKEYVELK